MLPGLNPDGSPPRHPPQGAPDADRLGIAFAIDEPVSVMSPVVFASPHSGRLYPAACLDGCAVAMIDLRRIEDAYVDRLLSEVSRAGVPVIYGLVGRACIDLNRAESEMDPAMFVDPSPQWRGPRSPRVDAGLGCIPRVAFNGVPIYNRKLHRREAESRVEGIYRPYHRALSALLKRAQAMFGEAWLIDCHSMPADAEPSSRSPDVVIGDRFGASCGYGLAEYAESLFRRRGYATVRNAPYAGGFSTVTHGQPAERRHALQIEVRRGLYLDETRVEPTNNFVTLRRDMTEIASEISAFTRDAVGLGPGNTKKNAALEASAAKVIGRKRP